MHTSTVKYLGELQTECTHLKSGTKIITDAPEDNNGKGSSFSPTDLVATSLASCMLTIVAIYCATNNYFFQYGETKVTKIMSSSPRKIEKIIVEMNLSGNNWDEKTKEKVIRAAKACPVAVTLIGNVELEYTFIA